MGHVEGLCPYCQSFLRMDWKERCESCGRRFKFKEPKPSRMSSLLGSRQNIARIATIGVVALGVLVGCIIGAAHFLSQESPDSYSTQTKAESTP